MSFVVFFYGDLCLYLLFLFVELFQYGYGIIQLLIDCMGGMYIFSVGIIYFWFVKFEEDGLVIKIVDGCIMIYVIMEVGCVELVVWENDFVGIEVGFMDLV